jgi:hypothetical protein
VEEGEEEEDEEEALVDERASKQNPSALPLSLPSQPLLDPETNPLDAHLGPQSIKSRRRPFPKRRLKLKKLETGTHPPPPLRLLSASLPPNTTIKGL